MEVDSEAIELVAELKKKKKKKKKKTTVLLVVDSPVDNVESEPMPVDVEVDSEAIELVAELRPVEVDVGSKSTWTAKRRCYWWSTARWTTS
ncbi:chromosome segregation ATPase [Burkholderia pseudomallei]|nr:chromosome segregation ATPase [Burkholderia pseudomallei]